MDPRLYPPLRELEHTHWWFRGRRRILLAALERAGVRASTLLDVGCGAGANLAFLAQRFDGARCFGIDVERGPLHACREAGGLAVCQADAARLPFASGRFDLVTALDALEHVEDDAAALRECFRVLRPGGALLASVPAFRALWGNVDELGHHHRRYRRSELLARVEAAGFEPVLDRYYNFLLFPPIAAVRLLARALPGRHPLAGETPRSDFDLAAGGPLGELLARIFASEARLLAFRAPFGVSLLCVARRRAAPAPAGPREAAT
jgi:ubiquinone/menaquinone biosynthesis C-methylase UbiE